MLIQCIDGRIVDTRLERCVTEALSEGIVMSVSATAEDVLGVLGFDERSYMGRCLLAAELPEHVLEVVFPRLACETRSGTISSLGLLLRRLGKEIRPEVATVLDRTRASGLVVQHAGLQKWGGIAEEQMVAAKRAKMAVKLRRVGVRRAGGED